MYRNHYCKKINRMLALASLFFTGCCLKNDYITSKISLVFDQTDSTEILYNPPRISQFGFKEARLNGDGLYRNGAEFDIGIIADKSTTEIASFIVPPVPSKCWDWVEKEREDSVKARRANLEKAIAQRTKQGVLKHSYVNRNLQQHLVSLANAKADIRELIVFSDLIQNNPHSVSFFAYPNPADILNNYSAIADSLSKDAPLPSLKGIEIKVVFIPARQTDELHRIAKQFWKRYWEEKGATVTFSSNL